MKAKPYTINMEEATITHHVAGHPDIVFHVEMAHPDNNQRAMYAGYAQQRLLDGAAVLRARKDGTLKTDVEMAREKWERMSAIVDHLESGSAEWGRKARTATTDDTALILRAMVEVSGKTHEEVNAIVDKRAASLSVSRSAVLGALALQDNIAAKIREYRAERVAGIDVADWMNELPE